MSRPRPQMQSKSFTLKTQPVIIHHTPEYREHAVASLTRCQWTVKGKLRCAWVLHHPAEGTVEYDREDEARAAWAAYGF